jgi:DNA repair exonuclease SbcCD nuclease subunit
MTAYAVRFLHASDFHLEQPAYGLSEVPESLRELLVDAPYRAAANVFRTALAERVDFVVLCGDLVQPWSSGPRGPLFLIEQFQLLGERGIPVYWATGKVDEPEAWPRDYVLPNNVHRFDRGRLTIQPHFRDAREVARICGWSRIGQRKLNAEDLVIPHDSLFTLVMAHGAPESAVLDRREIEYWALGGKHNRATLTGAPHWSHYCGSPQGRSPDEPGPHGCTLVEVSHTCEVSVQTVNNDVVRWHDERITLTENLERSELESILRERATAIRHAAPDMTHLVRWTLEGDPKWVRGMQRGMLAAEVLSSLRADFGIGAHPIWSLSIEGSKASIPAPHAFGADTLLGDFLQELHELKSDPGGPPDLSDLLNERQAAGMLGELVRIGGSPALHRVLEQAAQLGIELLAPEER